MNFSFYKDIVAKDRFRLQFTALLDNAFNHPQFFPAYGTTRFTDMNDYLANGIDEQRRHRGARGGDTIGNAEGFSTGQSHPPRHKSHVLASSLRRGARPYPESGRAPRRRHFGDHHP